MAISDYVCSECGFTDEYMTGFSAPKAMLPPENCPKCSKGKMEKQFGYNKRIGFNFIGEGFYCNDYGKGNFSKRSTSDKADILNGKNPY